MSNTYEKIKKEGEFNYNQNLVKSYIIESNLNEIHRLFESYKNGFEITIRDIDKNLYDVGITKEKTRANFYLDAMNPRFLVFHSISDVEDSDNLIKNLVSQILSKLDHIWLDKNFLREIKRQNADYSKGIGIQYRYGELFPTKDVGDTLTMKARGSLSDTILKEMENNAHLSKFLTITSVGFKKVFTAYDGEQNDVIIEDINYQGKFSAKGTSIYQHLQIIDEIQKKYENNIRIIENEYGISYIHKKKEISIKGAPLLITLKKEIEDLENFIKVIISSKNPFRLAGFSKMLDNGTALVSGVDLHNGDEFNLELTKEWIRFYLPKNACGNTVMRFLSNLQRYYDANAHLEGFEYGKIV